MIHQCKERGLTKIILETDYIITHPVVCSHSYNILYTSLPSMIDKIPVSKLNSIEEDIFKALFF